MNTWNIIEPGLIELATTKIRIRHERLDVYQFVVESDGQKLHRTATLGSAKLDALAICNELLLMGIEP